jgi:hypothetical protein
MAVMWSTMPEVRPARSVIRSALPFDTSGNTPASWHHQKKLVQPAQSNPRRVFDSIKVL